MKPEAVICDIDGTLALRGNRKPYDLTRVSEDAVNIPVATVVKALASMGFDIFYTSGRDEIVYDETADWLDTHVGVNFHRLMMRPHGDSRPDAQIKEEMLGTIQLTHHVFLVLDDRDSVVAMWRDNKIPTWQVNWGNF
jgi:hypothetical protein